MMDNKTAQAVDARAETRLAAMKAADRARLSDILHDKLIYIHSSARLDDKASFISSVQSGTLVYHDFTISDVAHIEVSPDAVLRTGILFTRVTARGSAMELNNRFIELWVLDGGAWRMLSWQSTPAAIATA